MWTQHDWQGAQIQGSGPRFARQSGRCYTEILQYLVGVCLRQSRSRSETALGDQNNKPMIAKTHGRPFTGKLGGTGGQQLGVLRGVVRSCGSA